MSILSGFKKVRRLIRLPDGYKQLSFWTSSQTVEMDDGSTLESNKSKWDDKYTKTEIDHKLSTIETNFDWKESVNTFSNIAVAYPDPQDGWTVNVKDTDYTYRYNGNEWVAISANAIPKATNLVNGLLAKEDHINYEDAVAKKHEHSNKGVLDSLTSEKVSKWNTLAESNVTGVKGNTESSYRTGNVNLTPANIGALPTTGGTLTGNVSFNMNSSTQIPLKVYGGDTYGQGISVGAGGATIVGGGESAKSCESLLSAPTEELWLTSDSNIYFYTNCQTIGKKVGVVLNTSRQFYPATNNAGSIGTSSYKWANVYTNTLNGTTLSANALATSSVPGLTKLYTSTGTSTDGTMTRKAITDAIPTLDFCEKYNSDGSSSSRNTSSFSLINLVSTKLNTNSNIFDDTSVYGIKVKQSGYYLVWGSVMESATGNYASVKRLSVRDLDTGLDLTGVITRGITANTPWQTIITPPIIEKIDCSDGSKIIVLYFQDESGSYTLHPVGSKLSIMLIKKL